VHGRIIAIKKERRSEIKASERFHAKVAGGGI
jgi:hypothetical protein